MEKIRRDRLILLDFLHRSGEDQAKTIHVKIKLSGPHTGTALF